MSRKLLIILYSLFIIFMIGAMCCSTIVLFPEKNANYQTKTDEFLQDNIALEWSMADVFDFSKQLEPHSGKYIEMTYQDDSLRKFKTPYKINMPLVELTVKRNDSGLPMQWNTLTKVEFYNNNLSPLGIVCIRLVFSALLLLSFAASIPLFKYSRGWFVILILYCTLAIYMFSGGKFSFISAAPEACSRLAPLLEIDNRKVIDAILNTETRFQMLSINNNGKVESFPAFISDGKIFDAQYLRIQIAPYSYLFWIPDANLSPIMNAGMTVNRLTDNCYAGHYSNWILYENILIATNYLGIIYSVILIILSARVLVLVENES